MKHFWLGALWVALVGCSAGGTETDNPDSVLKDFSSSTCKSRPSTSPQALVLASGLDGLQCVQWELSQTGSLELALVNFPLACADRYRGKAEREPDGTLALSSYKDQCSTAACGSCLFDLSYELAGTFEAAPLKLRIGSAACETAPTEWGEELELPLAQQSSGILCRYLDAGPLFWFAATRGTCGEPNMPCGDCSSDQQSSCTAGASCVALSEDDSRCLVSCETDLDCVPGATTCQAGSCQAKVSW